MTTRPDEWHWPELPGLLEEWREQWREGDGTGCKDEFLARQAADWQLNEVCAWMCDIGHSISNVQAIKEAMRPAPPATAATALAALDEINHPLGCVTASRCQQIRLALQRLQQFEREAGQ